MLKDNLQSITKELNNVQGIGYTAIAHGMGYTSTSQLHRTLAGDAEMSAKAMELLIKNYNVNPTYLLLGTGQMYLSKESISNAEKDYHYTKEDFKIVEARLDSIRLSKNSIESFIASDQPLMSIGYHVGVHARDIQSNLNIMIDLLRKGIIES